MGTSYLSMMESRMPPGFRFHPRDEELISDYLAKKLSGDSMAVPMLVDVDLNKVEPWDLPGEACVGGKEWYFYSLRDRKYATGQRTNRATISGYWKATGKDRPVVHEAGRGGKLVGMRKTLVFYRGRAPKGKKSDWVMHEFRAEPPPCIATAGDHSHKRSSSSSTSKEDWVLCRVFYKSRGLSMKPSFNNNDHHNLASTSIAASASENCYDDTGSSSLPPLIDNTYINFEQPQHTTMQGLFNGQVPCFSTLLSSPHTPFPLLDNHQPMDAIRNQLVSFSDLNPLMMGGLSGNQSRMEDGGRKPAMPPPPEVSSESYLTEAGGQSVWASMC